MARHCDMKTDGVSTVWIKTEFRVATINVQECIKILISLPSLPCIELYLNFAFQDNATSSSFVFLLPAVSVTIWAFATITLRLTCMIRGLRNQSGHVTWQFQSFENVTFSFSCILLLHLYESVIICVPRIPKYPDAKAIGELLAFAGRCFHE